MTWEVSDFLTGVLISSGRQATGEVKRLFTKGMDITGLPLVPNPYARFKVRAKIEDGGAWVEYGSAVSIDSPGGGFPFDPPPRN